MYTKGISINYNLRLWPNLVYQVILVIQMWIYVPKSKLYELTEGSKFYRWIAKIRLINDQLNGNDRLIIYARIKKIIFRQNPISVLARMFLGILLTILLKTVSILFLSDLSFFSFSAVCWRFRSFFRFGINEMCFFKSSMQ